MSVPFRRTDAIVSFIILPQKYNELLCGQSWVGFQEEAGQRRKGTRRLVDFYLAIKIYSLIFSLQQLFVFRALCSDAGLIETHESIQGRRTKIGQGA